MRRKKTDTVQLSKIRMREELRARLARDAERNATTLNGEIVDRLERSYRDEDRIKELERRLEADERIKDIQQTLNKIVAKGGILVGQPLGQSHKGMPSHPGRIASVELPKTDEEDGK